MAIFSGFDDDKDISENIEISDEDILKSINKSKMFCGEVMIRNMLNSVSSKEKKSFRAEILFDGNLIGDGKSISNFQMSVEEIDNSKSQRVDREG